MPSPGSNDESKAVAHLRAQLDDLSHVTLSNPVDERAEIARWIRAIINFSKSLHLPLRHPLILADAIMQLDNGAVAPVLAPKRNPKGGRAPTGMMMASLQGAALGTVRALIECGDRLPAARDSVAKVLDQAGIRATRGSGKITGRTIKEWSDAAAANPRSQVARFLKKFPSAASPEQSERSARKAELLRALRTTARSLAARQVTSLNRSRVS